MFVTRRFLILFSVLAMACSSSAPMHETIESLEGTSWTVVSIEGSALVSDSNVTVRFEAEGQMSGEAGCNQYLGSYGGQDSTLRFKLTGASKKLCGEPHGIMEQESQFLSTLDSVATFTSLKEQLEFFDADGKPVLILKAVSGDE